MTLSSFDRRRARNGKGLLPPNPKHWETEHNGLDLRSDLGLAFDLKLSVEAAFALLPNVHIMPHGEVLAARSFIDHFRGPGQANWSGLAIHIDGQELVLYNDSHPPNRIRATLMEEFFHLRLGHPRTALRLLNSGDGNRTYDTDVELQAYCSGAAALVPFCVLKKMLADGLTVASIAATFGVSRDLVQFRRKICRLYQRRGN